MSRQNFIHNSASLRQLGKRIEQTGQEVIAVADAFKAAVGEIPSITLAHHQTIRKGLDAIHKMCDEAEKKIADLAKRLAKEPFGTDSGRRD